MLLVSPSYRQDRQEREVKHRDGRRLFIIIITNSGERQNDSTGCVKVGGTGKKQTPKDYLAY